MKRTAAPGCGATVSVVLFVALSATPGFAAPLDPMITHDPFAYYGRTIGEVHVEGVPWAHDLEQKIRGAVRPKQRLWLPGVQRAIVDILFNDSTPGRRPSRITVLAEPESGSNVAIRFVLEPTRKIESVVIVGETSLDHSTLIRAANLPLGAAFWPDDMDAASRRIAAAYFEAGWRDTSVGWEAKSNKAGDDVTIAFAVVEGVPTTLVQLEFSGQKGLSDGELFAAFSINPGQRVSLDLVDEGIQNLLSRYHEKHYYLARVTQQIAAADGRAVVEVHLSCGPRFRLQVRGNRTFSEDLLLSKLHYNGEDPLDENIERDMALRIASFYLAAGFATAQVLPCENAQGVVGCVTAETEVPAKPDGEPGERLVTFLVTEGPAFKVVERRFEGVQFADPEFSSKKLFERVDAALADAVPSELTSETDDQVRAAVDSSGLPGKPQPTWRVVPPEVFLPPAYAAACNEITRLYQSKGFLNARVGDARIQDLGNHRLGVVIPVDEGVQLRIRSVSIVRWREFNPSQAVSDDDADYLPADDVTAEIQKTLLRLGLPEVTAGKPVSSTSLDEARKAIIQLYKSRAHLFVKADYREVVDDAGDAEDVIFGVKAGKEVRVASIEIKGATHTDQKLIREALEFKEDDPANRVPCAAVTGSDSQRVISSCVTPSALDRSVYHLLLLQIFTSATVDIADPDRDDMPNQRLIVQVHEKASITLEFKPGISLADGPRFTANMRFANLGNRNNSFAVSIKIDYPVFRYNDLFVASACGEACAPTNNLLEQFERHEELSLGLPIYRSGEAPIDVHPALVEQNTVRPAYRLQGESAVLTVNNLLHQSIDTRWAEVPDETGAPHIKRVEFTGDFQSDIEYDNFARYSGGVDVSTQSTADQKALLLPNGQVALVSVRPTLRFDARDSKINPTMGVFASLAVDFSKSFINSPLATDNGSGWNPVQLLSGLFSVSGYIPIYRPRRLELVLSGRIGGIVHAGPASEVIASKRFFLGGTASLQGYNEDDLVPEDQRAEIHQAIARCHSLISQGTCGTTANGQPLDPELLAVANGTGVSTGGDYMALVKAELRFAILSWMDGAIFIDGGNLWVDASQVNLTDLRYAVGGGISVPLPIGPAELGVGVPLHPDPLLQEPTYRVFLSIGTY